MSDPTDARIPPGWVPVERRFLGMDRPTLLPAGIVAALVALAVWVLPAIDRLALPRRPGAGRRRGAGRRGRDLLPRGGLEHRRRAPGGDLQARVSTRGASP
ncbi:hypothetical protein [Nocardioides convexus]|uniref:hypothetical protein n=1 Tax=Nocardioides convexus TaxID=2712224 RepID=UPI00241814D4|nr:hypothetical protein [Nocardioides convexus]